MQTQLLLQKYLQNFQKTRSFHEFEVQQVTSDALSKKIIKVLRIATPETNSCF